MHDHAHPSAEPSLPSDLTPERLRVAVIGTGAIGAGVALLFARAGYTVSTYNRSARGRDRARKWINLALQILVEADVETESAAREAVERIRSFVDIEEAAAGAGYILEAVAEDFELKREIFCRLDHVCPSPAILATGTSSLSVTLVAEATGNPERVVGTHHFTPAHLVPGVEVIAGAKTSPGTVAATCALLRRLKRRPVRVPDVPGFVANRLSCALRREAWAIVEEGLAEAEQVDELWMSTVGLPFLALGPLQISDASGLDVLLAVHGYVEPVLKPPSEPAAIVQEMVRRGDFGLKTGRGFYEWPQDRVEDLSRRRDSLLLAILKHQDST